MVDEGDEHSRTALMLAAGGGHAEIVAALVEHGADVNLRNHKNETALEVAARTVAHDPPCFRKIRKSINSAVQEAPLSAECGGAHGCSLGGEFWTNLASQARSLLRYGSCNDEVLAAWKLRSM